MTGNIHIVCKQIAVLVGTDIVACRSKRNAVRSNIDTGSGTGERRLPVVNGIANNSPTL